MKTKLNHLVLIISGILLSGQFLHALTTHNVASEFAGAGYSYLLGATPGGTGTALTPNVAIAGSTATGYNDGFASVIGVDSGSGLKIYTSGSANNAEAGKHLVMHGSSTDDTTNPWTIVRYTFSAADLAHGSDARIRGNFFNQLANNNSPTIHAAVFHNTTQLWAYDSINSADGNVSEAQGSFNEAWITYSAGDTISFAIDAVNDSSATSETRLLAEIIIPEPSTYALFLGAGALALLIRKRSSIKK